MSMDLLGPSFDIHGGGKDLVFPHHENEIAQSEGTTGKPFVKYWMHNGFVNINQEKMSKSLGNFFTIREILKSTTRKWSASSSSPPTIGRRSISLIRIWTMRRPG